ncbi:MAG: NAD(P)-dependent oxidoreductase [Candidatus Bathyarchaeota archaeon]|nr:NAD(P)-dependent oxidoreductase [Candidatus Bathyarchaeota archaeon]
MVIDDFKKRKVLVTGGGGFIGSKLVHVLLEKGCRVKVLDVRLGRLKEESNPNLEFIGIGSDELHGGIADKDLVEHGVEDVDVIYHLAINWDALTWRHVLPLADLFDANVRGTLNLLEAAKSHGVRHFLFSSSEAVYGKAKSLFIDEETVCKPELWRGDPGPAYGILKLTTEKLCLMYYHRYGLPVTAFRIQVVFNDDEALLLSGEVVDKVLKGEIVELIEGEGRASIHVDEVVEAFLLATLNEKAYGEVFNLSNPATYMSYRELYQFFIQQTGSKSELRLITDPMLISSMPECIEKIQRTLGWNPQKTKEDLKKALVQSVRSLLTHSKT